MIEIYGLATAAAYVLIIAFVVVFAAYLIDKRRQKRLMLSAQNLNLTLNGEVWTRDVDGFPLSVRFEKSNDESSRETTVFEMFIGAGLPVDLVIRPYDSQAVDSPDSQKIRVGSTELDENLHVSGKNQQVVLDWAKKGKTLQGLSLLCRLDLGEPTLERGTLRLMIPADLTTEEELAAPIAKLAEIARCLSV